jgi:hypothetical protein
VQGLPFKRPTPCLCFTPAHSARRLLHACFCSPESCHLLPTCLARPLTTPALHQHFHIGSCDSAFGQSHCHTSSSQPSEGTLDSPPDSRRPLPTASFFASSPPLAQPGQGPCISSVRLDLPPFSSRPFGRHLSPSAKDPPLIPPPLDHINPSLAALNRFPSGTSSPPVTIPTTSATLSAHYLPSTTAIALPACLVHVVPRRRPPQPSQLARSTLAPSLSLDRSASWPTTRRRQSRPWATGLSNRPLRCSSKDAWVGWTMTVARDRTPQVTQTSKARSSRRKAHTPW